jgi:hypothetical protein
VRHRTWTGERNAHKVLVDKPLEKWPFRRLRSWNIHINTDMKELDSILFYFFFFNIAVIAE